MEAPENIKPNKRIINRSMNAPHNMNCGIITDRNNEGISKQMYTYSEVVINGLKKKLRMGSIMVKHRKNDVSAKTAEYKEYEQRKFEYDLIKNKIDTQMNNEQYNQKDNSWRGSIAQSTPVSIQDKKKSTLEKSLRKHREVELNEIVSGMEVNNADWEKVKKNLTRVLIEEVHKLNKLENKEDFKLIMNELAQRISQSIQLISKSEKKPQKDNIEIKMEKKQGRPSYECMKAEYDKHQRETNNKCTCMKCQKVLVNWNKIIKRIESNANFISRQDKLDVVSTTNNKLLSFLKVDKKDSIQKESLLDENDKTIENSEVNNEITNISNNNCFILENRNDLVLDSNKGKVEMNIGKSEEAAVSIKLEALANNKILMFTGNSLVQYENAKHAELVNEIYKVISGIQVKSVVIKKNASLKHELYITAFDELDYAMLKEEKHHVMFGGVQLRPIKCKLFLHTIINKDTQVDCSKDNLLQRELSQQGIERITLDKMNESTGKSCRAMIEVNSVEKWFELLGKGITIHQKYYGIKCWKFQPKFCKKCLRYRHKTANCQTFTNSQKVRCQTCTQIHNDNESCSLLTICYNCKSTEHKSGSKQCPVWVEEDRKCNSLYDELLAIKKPAYSKYNMKYNDNQYKQSDAASTSSGHSSTGRMDDSIMALKKHIERLEKDQKEVAIKMSKLENKMETRMEKIEKEVSSLPEALKSELRSMGQSYEESSLRNMRVLMAEFGLGKKN